MKAVRTIVLSAVAAFALSSAVPAMARDNVALSFDVGNLAFAYNDGWWDNGHHWHKWRNAGEHRYFREHYAPQYNAWKHTRDHDKGWHDRH